MSNNNIIAVKGLTKTFYPPPGLKDLFRPKQHSRKSVKALKNIDFYLPQGKVLGILGPNGSGKTTLLKCLSTLIIQDSGEIIIAGHDIKRFPNNIKKNIGFVLADERSFYWRLSGRANLEFFAIMQGLSHSEAKGRIKELLDLFAIDYADKRFDSYSTGMKRKFGLIRALLHDPRILLIDELTKSLDLESTEAFDLLIKKLAGNNVTILLTGHNIDQLENLCDLFMFLHQGSLLAFGSLEQLQSRYSLPQAKLTRIYRDIFNHV